MVVSGNFAWAWTVSEKNTHRKQNITSVLFIFTIHNNTHVKQALRMVYQVLFWTVKTGVVAYITPQSRLDWISQSKFCLKWNPLTKYSIELCVIQLWLTPLLCEPLTASQSNLNWTVFLHCRWAPQDPSAFVLALWHHGLAQEAHAKHFNVTHQIMIKQIYIQIIYIDR